MSDLLTPLIHRLDQITLICEPGTSKLLSLMQPGLGNPCPGSEHPHSAAAQLSSLTDPRKQDHYLHLQTDKPRTPGAEKMCQGLIALKKS